MQQEAWITWQQCAAADTNAHCAASLAAVSYCVCFFCALAVTTEAAAAAPAAGGQQQRQQQGSKQSTEDADEEVS